MTKFIEWLSALSLFLAVWSLTYSGSLFGPLSEEAKFQILLTPIYLLLTAGIISAGVVLYRTATFNDCPEAAAELRIQIKDAREDLISKGFKFRSQ